MLWFNFRIGESRAAEATSAAETESCNEPTPAEVRRVLNFDSSDQERLAGKLRRCAAILETTAAAPVATAPIATAPIAILGSSLDDLTVNGPFAYVYEHNFVADNDIDNDGTESESEHEHLEPKRNCKRSYKKTTCDLCGRSLLVKNLKTHKTTDICRRSR